MRHFLCFVMLIVCGALKGQCSEVDLFMKLNRLKEAYPEHIAHVSETEVIWKDGSVMEIQNAVVADEILDHPSVADQLALSYPAGSDTWGKHAAEDPGRFRCDAFFRKMYGASEHEVKKNLVKILWMPRTFGTQYPLYVTRINDVHIKIQKISEELDTLPPSFKKYLQNPGGTFCWRKIAGTNRQSPHSFGMTLDINTSFSHYWQWDYRKEHKLPQDATVPEDVALTYRNAIPWEIVAIFEKYGFIWGGKWRHYDTMHFEYRPELFAKKTESELNMIKLLPETQK